jgi:fucose permease
MRSSFLIRNPGWLYLGFALTGVGTALLGCILPALSAAWHLNDEQAGLLLAAQFSGSASGALLVGRNFSAAVVRGFSLLAAGSIAIAFFPQLPRLLVFFAFGLGLGLSMTATSMLIGSTYAGKRASTLSLLNAFWTIGAALAPQIAFFWVERWQPSSLFIVFALTVLLAVGLAGPRRLKSPDTSDSGIPAPPQGDATKLILIFIGLGFLYVGVESSIGGWLMTYVQRLPIAHQAWAPLATSIFWIGLLCGRLLAPAALLRVSEARLLGVCLGIAFASTALLLLEQNPIAITLTVAAAGCGLGPIFPLLLAKALAALNDSPRAKWVFAMSGLGGAALPWIIGALSARRDSLRVGLAIPVIALLGMMLLNSQAEPVSDTPPAL